MADPKEPGALEKLAKSRNLDLQTPGDMEKIENLLDRLISKTEEDEARLGYIAGRIEFQSYQKVHVDKGLKGAFKNQNPDATFDIRNEGLKVNIFRDPKNPGQITIEAHKGNSGLTMLEYERLNLKEGEHAYPKFYDRTGQEYYLDVERKKDGFAITPYARKPEATLDDGTKTTAGSNKFTRIGDTSTLLDPVQAPPKQPVTKPECAPLTEDQIHEHIATIQRELHKLTFLSETDANGNTNLHKMWDGDTHAAYQRLMIEIQTRSSVYQDAVKATEGKKYEVKVDGYYGKITKRAMDQDPVLQKMITPELKAAIEALCNDEQCCLQYQLGHALKGKALTDMMEKVKTEPLLFPAEVAGAGEGGVVPKVLAAAAGVGSPFKLT